MVRESLGSAKIVLPLVLRHSSGVRGAMEIDSRWLFVLLVVAVAAERLVELRISRRNTLRALARGGHEVGGEHYPVMVALHTGLLIAAPLEVFLLRRPFLPGLAAAAVATLGAAMGLRYWVIATLGERWTTRVIIEDRPAIRRGPFRLLRHPNYLAVAMEVLALPLVHGAWISALVFSLANAALLRRRVRVEEDALRRHCDYDALFGAGPRGAVS